MYVLKCAMLTMLQSSPFYRLTLDQLRSHAGLRVQENGPILVLLFPLTADGKKQLGLRGK